jgi:hypothetical protein
MPAGRPVRRAASRNRRRSRLRTTALPIRFPIAKAKVVVSSRAGSRETVSGPDRAAGARRSLSKTGRRLVVHLKLPGGPGPSAGAPSELLSRLSSTCDGETHGASPDVGCGVGKDVSLVASYVRPVTAQRHAVLSPPAAASRVARCARRAVQLVRVGQAAYGVLFQRRGP